MDPLERLLAEREIRDVIYRYCRGVDRVDLDLVRSCYHPDGVDDHGSFRGIRDAYVDWLAERLGRYHHTSHTIGNVLIRLAGGEAWVESYCGVHQRYGGEDGALLDRFGDLRYVDRFALRDGHWLISHRRVVWGTARVDPVGESALPAGSIVGRRDRSDPSYTVPGAPE